jgi:CubicO group peptidase (beta-lactamase class C family)
METSVSSTLPKQMDGFFEFVKEQMDNWKVPGLAISVVKDGKVLLCEGFGQRNVENNLPVTPDTQFAIASSSKAFTTLALGLLVDEGFLEWDKPIKDYLPPFKLHDQFASERMTARDLVSHRSGLPRHELMWYGSPFSREETFNRIQYLKPTRDFRTAFQYQNIMYMVAGYLIEKLSGLTWEEFVEQKIFKRLKMDNSNFSVNTLQQSSDYAFPYSEKEEELIKLPFRNVDALGPAGSINSTLKDMTKWLSLQLNKGKVENEQFITEINLQDMHSPQMIIQEPSKHPELILSTYGLGWFIQDYKGNKMVHHGGNLDGFSAMVSFMPEHNIGTVILTNKNATPIRDFLAFNVYDRLLDLDITNWSERFKSDHQKQKENAKEGKEKSETDRKVGTQPSHPLEDYIGKYTHKGYGELTVSLEDNHLLFSYNAISEKLEHYHYDVFSFKYEAWGLQFKVQFQTDKKGSISSLSTKLEPTGEEIEFTRVPNEVDRNVLEKYTGTYELSTGTSFSVNLSKDDSLTLVIPGQPQRKLLSINQSEFDIENLNGNTIQFITESNGGANEAKLVQPNGVFTGKKRGNK